MKPFENIALALMFFLGAAASFNIHAFSFNITQNTKWQLLTIYVENCEKVQGTQSCVFQVLNNQEGGTTRNCNGMVFDGNTKVSCYSLDQVKGYVYLVLNGNNFSAGRCKVYDGQTIEARSLCGGVEAGAFDPCPGGADSSTFRCNVL